MLQFPWEYPTPKQKKTGLNWNDIKVLCVDLGQVNLATLVECHAGLQLSPPRFIKQSSYYTLQFKRLYKQLSKLQRKLARYPKTWFGQGRRQQEVNRLYNKINRLRYEVVTTLSNVLVQEAVQHQCHGLILEDLRLLTSKKGSGRISRDQNNWLRGYLLQVLSYKCKQVGLHLDTVNPWRTSSYCPRCGHYGHKIKAPNDPIKTKYGRYFSCPNCQFVADRDYIGALNIYRVFRLKYQHKGRKKRYKSLHSADPVLYQRTGTPIDCPSGGSEIPILSVPGCCVGMTGG